MNFLEKLDLLMAGKGLNKNTLSKSCSIPYTTIDNWYKRGYGGLKLTTLRKLSDYFDVPLDFWTYEDMSDLKVTIEDSRSKILKGREKEIIMHFCKLNDIGQEKALEYIHDLTYINLYTEKEENE